MNKLTKIWRKACILPIVIYQKTLSPDHGILKALHPHGHCRFHPSCSQYTRQAILKYGAVRGILKGMWRILRCNPWSKGGINKP